MTKIEGLKTYQIEIIETMSQIIDIIAEDGQTALLKAQKMYRNEEVVLYSNTHIDTEYNIFSQE